MAAALSKDQSNLRHQPQATLAFHADIQNMVKNSAEQKELQSTTKVVHVRAIVLL